MEQYVVLFLFWFFLICLPVRRMFEGSKNQNKEWIATVLFFHAGCAVIYFSLKYLVLLLAWAFSLAA